MNRQGVMPTPCPSPRLEYPSVVKTFYQQWSADHTHHKVMEASHPPLLKDLFKDNSLKYSLEKQLGIEQKVIDTVCLVHV